MFSIRTWTISVHCLKCAPALLQSDLREWIERFDSLSISRDNNNHTNSNIFRPWPANSAIYFFYLTAGQVSSDSLWTSWARSLRIRQRTERIGGHQRWQGEVWRYITKTKRYFLLLFSDYCKIVLLLISLQLCERILLSQEWPINFL